MPTVRIVRTETVKRGVNADLFNPFTDPLTLRLTVNFSPDFLQLQQPIARVTYQIISFYTNQIAYQLTDDFKAIFPSTYTWIDLPNAHDIGLSWIESEIFGFRGAAQLFNYDEVDGYLSLDALSVGPTHWFHVESVFTL